MRNRDANGNLLSEVAGRYQKDYVYNAQNRMAFSEVLDRAENTRNLTEYRYDAFGRRIETIEYLGDHTRNLYDGFSFDIAEKTVLQTHAAATMPEQKYRAGSAAGHPEPGSGSASTGRSGAGVANGTRYRYIGDEPLENSGSAGAGNAGAASAQAGTTAAAKTRSRPNSEYVLYAQGEPVAVNADGAQSYFGTDILGSVRSVTDKYGQVTADYSYDAFGTPYISNDFDSGAGFGYCGKPYDVGTGLYDYGFRDYSPNSARFTTVDPVRDGSNWFSYVVNDPVNYVDPFGLETLKEKAKRTLVAEDWILYNDTDLIAVAYREEIHPEEFTNKDGSINAEKYASYISKMIIYPGEKSEFKIDGGSIPANGNIDNPSYWTYAGVTDGNSLRFSGDKTTGYEVLTENTTYGETTFGNIVSKLNPVKGPYDGLNSMSFWNKDMRGWYPAENQAPADIRQQVYSDATILASALNNQWKNDIQSSNITSNTAGNSTFSNISFDGFGNAVLSQTTDFSARVNEFSKNAFNIINPYSSNSFLGGCTK